MYTVTKNIKIICFTLMAIGLLSLLYGFYSASSSYSNYEIKKEVKTLYKSISKDDKKNLKDQYDSHGKSHSKNQPFAYLFHAIEKQLNCHFTDDEIARAQTIDDVIYITKHYFHSKKQRPWSSLLVSNLFFLMISLGALVWLAVQYISQSGWSASLLRIPQAVSSFLPYGAAIMLFIIITGALHWHHTYQAFEYSSYH